MKEAINTTTTTITEQTSCPPSCPCPILLSVASSITHQEDALACILNAECAKLNKVVASYSDVDALIAIDTSVQATLEQITALEGVLKAKLDSVIPLLIGCK